MSRTEILQEAIKKYGINNQCNMCIEEMAELTKELLKLRRESTQAGYKSRQKNIKEEIADVQIMLDQMKMIFGDTAEQEELKVNRLKERMERD